jgi:hypothetical protein
LENANRRRAAGGLAQSKTQARGLEHDFKSHAGSLSDYLLLVRGSYYLKIYIYGCQEKEASTGSAQANKPL